MCKSQFNATMLQCPNKESTEGQLCSEAMEESSATTTMGLVNELTWLATENVTYKIHWYDGDQLPGDIYRALDMNTAFHIMQEDKNEEVTYGDTLYGLDDPNEEL